MSQTLKTYKTIGCLRLGCTFSDDWTVFAMETVPWQPLGVLIIFVVLHTPWSPSHIHFLTFSLTQMLSLSPSLSAAYLTPCICSLASDPVCMWVSCIHGTWEITSSLQRGSGFADIVSLTHLIILNLNSWFCSLYLFAASLYSLLFLFLCGLTAF